MAKRDTFKPQVYRDPIDGKSDTNLGGSRDISRKVEAQQRADLSRTGSGAGRKMGGGKGKC